MIIVYLSQRKVLNFDNYDYLYIDNDNNISAVKDGDIQILKEYDTYDEALIDIRIAMTALRIGQDFIDFSKL